MNRRRCLFPVCLLPTAYCLLACLGCGGPSSAPVAAPTSAALEARQKEVSRRLFDSAVEAVNRLDDYDETRIDSAVEQVVRRLNESLESGLIDGKREDPFTVDDGKALREIVWLREAAEFAVGDAVEPLVRAERLFDWTIRNVQLIGDEAPLSAGVVDERQPYLPWHVLVLGRGTALDRAWLFTLLARQQGLEIVLLAPAEAEKSAASTPSLVGLVHDDQLRLFDTRWSTPLPGPGGKGIATLAQVRQDDALLRALDLDDVGGPKYPLTAADAEKLIAFVETSSLYLSPKFARLETLLSGDAKLVLSIDREASVATVKKCAGLGDVQPWPLRDERFEASRAKLAYDALVLLLKPFRAPPLPQGSRLIQSPIWQARVRHLAGKYVDPLSGKPTLPRLYQESRPPDAELNPLQVNPEIWTYAYRIKQNATYWLGLLSYDLNNYDTAEHYFELVLQEEANGGWTGGARYNLGRTYEAMNEPNRAAETYRATYLGLKPDAACLYRAKRLAE